MSRVILIQPKEPLWLSVARDAVSFGGLCGTAYFLNVVVPPSGWLNAALAACWLLWLMGKHMTEKITPAEARVWLDKNHPVAPEQARAA